MVSKLVVQEFVAFTGRGPVSVKTSIGEDVVHVVLRGQLTTTEKHLVAGGQGELVLASRRAVQEGLSAALIDGVATITGRTVEAFLSANHIGPDVAVETFVLEPLDETDVG